MVLRVVKKKTEVKSGGRFIIPEPPKDIFPFVLNRRRVDLHRTDTRNGLVTIHVSDLIKSDSSAFFCPREVALSKYMGAALPSRAHPPGMALLFHLGTAIHDHVRNVFLNDEDYGRAAFGQWSCPCGATHISLACRPDISCRVCGEPVRCYGEEDLFWDFSGERLGITGHPDFLLLWNGVLYVYEIKTLDRVTKGGCTAADEDGSLFSHIDAPLGDHVLQGSFYYWMLKKNPIIKAMGIEVSDQIRFLYVDRALKRSLFKGSPYKEFTTTAASLERLEPFLAKARVLQKACADQTGRVMPERKCTSSEKGRARTCSVCDACFARD